GNWATRTAPSLADLEQIAEAAFAALPEGFRRLCEGIVIRVDDFPDDETLDALQCESEFDLLGLFRGRGLAQRPATAETGMVPNTLKFTQKSLVCVRQTISFSPAKTKKNRPHRNVNLRQPCGSSCSTLSSTIGKSGLPNASPPSSTAPKIVLTIVGLSLMN